MKDNITLILLRIITVLFAGYIAFTQYIIPGYWTYNWLLVFTGVFVFALGIWVATVDV